MPQLTPWPLGRQLLRPLPRLLRLQAGLLRLEPHLQPSFSGLFPRDTAKNTRFAINFWTGTHVAIRPSATMLSVAARC